MAAAGFNGPQKKSLRDGLSGMSEHTKRHFAKVKRRMFEFVDRQHQMEFDMNHLPPPLPFQPNPQQVFIDQNKGLKPQLPHHHHHRTPVPPRRQFLTPAGAHKQLPHLALATPQGPRRMGK